MTIVADSSAVVAALIDGGPEGTWAREGLRGDDVAVPAHLHVEVSNVLRRAVLAGRLGVLMGRLPVVEVFQGTADPTR